MKAPLLPYHFYHIYTHAVGKDNLFLKAENYHYFLQQYAKYIHPIAETHAYCLMPNHIHFCIEIRSPKELETAYQRQQLGKKNLKNSKPFEGWLALNTSQQEKWLIQQFSHLFNGYTQAFNRQNNRRGNLFMTSFKRKSVANQDYLCKLIRYIHQNPVLHGFVKNVEDWQFSSFNTILSPKPSMINRVAVLKIFGDIDGFVQIHQERLTLEIA